MKFVLYGTETCSFCMDSKILILNFIEKNSSTKDKELLDVIYLKNDSDIKDLKNKVISFGQDSPTTIPQIFYIDDDGTEIYVGGKTQLISFLKNLKSNISNN